MYLQQGKQRTGTEEKVAARPLQLNLRVDHQTGDRHANPLGKGAEPRRGSSGRGSCAGTKKKTRGEQDNCYKTTPNPMRNHHRRSRAANLSQPAGPPAARHGAEKPQVFHDKLNRHTKEAQQEPTSPLAGGGRRRHSTAAYRKKNLQKQRKELIPPPQKRTESVTATPRTRSLTSGLAELNSWASVALTHCLTHEWEAEGTAGYLSRTPRARNIRLSPAVTPGRGSRTSDLSQA